MVSIESAHVFDFKLRHPRRNLPAAVRHKRGESNFVSAFVRHYISEVAPQGLGGKEFQLSGFGIADFVWIAWRDHKTTSDGTALTIANFPKVLARQTLTAFEMKLTDWRKGLAQAYRYSYFADRAVVVLPTDIARIARNHLATFRSLGIGLWSFDKESQRITKLYTPLPKARSKSARLKALASLTASFKLSKTGKQIHTVQ